MDNLFSVLSRPAHKAVPVIVLAYINNLTGGPTILELRKHLKIF